MLSFEYRSTLPYSSDVVFGWHLQDGAINRLIPAFENVSIESFEGVSEGSRATLRMKLGPFSKDWVAVHSDIVPGLSFTDTQESGPFKFWQHKHEVIPLEDGTSELVDAVRYQLPMEPIQESTDVIVKSKLEKVFRYRHRILHNDLKLHDRYGGEKLRFLVSGASGLIGSELVPFLRSGGHIVKTLVRREPSGDNEIYGNPSTNDIDAAALEGFDVVIHLAGGSLFKLWTPDNMKEMHDSRVEGTKLLSNTLAGLMNKPSVFVSASATGVYGHRDGEYLYENSNIDEESFLGKLCRDWERAADSARDAGIRTVHPRIGIVISGNGGALTPLVKQFKFGLGGVPGTPEGFVSWIAMDDVLGALYHLSATPFIEGPVNLTAPYPVTWAMLTETLGHVMRRPSFWRLPKPLVRLVGGHFAKEVLLSSARVSPSVLEDTAYDFLFMILDDAIGHQLGY